MAQFIERVADLDREIAGISGAEYELEDILFQLYKLTPEERVLVENDRSRRT